MADLLLSTQITATVDECWVNTIERYDNVNENIYNFDEIDFQMRVISTVKMMTESENHDRPVLLQSGN
ncbi:uncharacterized protein PADG_02617 [Paracoccidioides brasiliensis Pb18]|uniref:Uncharacterized protein n=1 Tax=Paracoccidioides brasiliensis (strain Pb18) TaxID=502780 RepID=C1G612_PARBD|nr:uncharacterized protein PADG_02617 [Paracoccidioides brasiliensis Pb18]EEH46519.2 hypothetical protein PADG_02617 [Paracoccidioides brasiliensis Pb18]